MARQAPCADIDGFTTASASRAGWRSADTRSFRALFPASASTRQCGPFLVEAPAPVDEEVLAVLHYIVGSILRRLTRRGL